MQIPLFTPPCDWSPPALADLPSWRGAKRVAFDLETYDPHLKVTGPSVRTGGHIAGYGFAIDGGPKHYLPIRHKGGDNLDPVQVRQYIKDQFKIFDGTLVGANLAYDLDWAWADGIEMPLVQSYRDILVAEPLIDENKYYYSLDSVAKEYLGERKEKTLMLEAARAYGMKKDKDLGAFIHLLPGRFVGLYGEQDCALPLKVLRHQEKEIERQDITGIWNLESKVLPVLVKMRQRGVRVDQDKLIQIETRAMQERREAAEFITKQTDVSVGPDDAMKKAILVEALRNAGHRIAANDSIDKVFIAKHEKACPVVAALGQLRKWDTLRKLSIDPVKAHMVNGRIHCTFNQLVADSDDSRGTKGVRHGRLSCEHVNMQQQPARDEDIGPLWRRVYVPDDGLQWAALDYSQQEPRFLVHFAEVCNFYGAAMAAQRYRDDPDTDNHQMMAEMANIKRKDAKIIFLGLCYNMGQQKLCNDLGLPTKIIEITRGPRKGQKMVVAGDEGAQILETFHTKVPFVKRMQELCTERATERGYITTILGRKCRFKKGDDGINYWGTHKALNRLIQGSAADQTKKAMVDADAAGFALQLQIHDEICLSVESREAAEPLAEIMRNCVNLNVPSKVDIEIGASWGQAA